VVAGLGLSAVAYFARFHTSSAFPPPEAVAVYSFGYISPDRARLTGNIAGLPLRREGAQTMRRVRRVSSLPNRAFDKSRLRQLGFRSDGSTPPR
jgi:hypothetical protein